MRDWLETCWELCWELNAMPADYERPEGDDAS